MDIKAARTNHQLLELINMALSSLNDSRINSLAVIEVRMSKGKYNADVYIEASDIDNKDATLSALRRAEPILREAILSATSWYKAPKLNFHLVKDLEVTKNLDEIFKILKSQKSSTTTSIKKADNE